MDIAIDIMALITAFMLGTIVGLRRAVTLLKRGKNGNMGHVCIDNCRGNERVGDS